MDAVRTAWVVGPMLIGLVGAHRMMSAVGSRRAQLATMAAYLLVPLAAASAASGSIAGLTAYASAPWLLRSGLGALGATPFGGSTRKAAWNMLEARERGGSQTGREGRVRRRDSLWRSALSLGASAGAAALLRACCRGPGGRHSGRLGRGQPAHRTARWRIPAGLGDRCGSTGSGRHSLPADGRPAGSGADMGCPGRRTQWVGGALVAAGVCCVSLSALTTKRCGCGCCSCRCCCRCCSGGDGVWSSRCASGWWPCRLGASLSSHSRACWISGCPMSTCFSLPRPRPRPRCAAWPWSRWSTICASLVSVSGRRWCRWRRQLRF